MLNQCRNVYFFLHLKIIYFILSSDIDVSDLSEWTPWSECSASCISENSFPMKKRIRCQLYGPGKECIEESQQCTGYQTCALG